MTKHRLLLLSDDDALKRSLHQKLEKNWGHTVRNVSSVEEMLSLCGELPTVLVIDIASPERNPAALFKEMRNLPETASLLVIGDATTQAALAQSMKLGADDYLEKPFEPLRMEAVFHQLLRRLDLEVEILRMREEMLGRFEDTTVVAESREMQLVLRMVEKLKDRDIPVLLSGEDGSGRELVARAIHARGKRKMKPYFMFTSASVPEDLLAGELFGYEKGAFPGAAQRKAGIFEQADGGTVYIDEIGDFDADLQARLLHLIEFKEVRTIGSDNATRVNVRIIAGSSHNLRDSVRNKEFRSDLYYHLASFPIHVPPLRDRGTDIILLAEQFLERHSSEANIAAKGFSREALEAIYHYPWPGNAQELDSAIHRAVSLAQGDIIGLQHLPIAVHPFKDASMELETEGKLFHDNKIVSLDRIKEQAVRRAVEIARGNLAHASRELDISRSTLYKLIEKYGISL
ncbi:MAG: sigma-54-dependent Fis family transcriptional regulator [Bacteroidetes bacterium]|nr:sigma-54-dependent Fis family transcriptional regulator [Bacteroidota bacterium]